MLHNYVEKKKSQLYPSNISHFTAEINLIALEPAPHCPLKTLKIHRLNFDAKNRWEIKLLIAVKRLKETSRVTAYYCRF